jgi:hypothetical protein
MDKQQALQGFWSDFGLPAYEEGTVDKDAVMPYITYNVITDNYENGVTLNADLWYYSEAWREIDRKANAIGTFIGLGGVLKKIDGGYLWVKKGTPFATHVTDPNNMVRRVRLSVNADFLTS